MYYTLYIYNTLTLNIKSTDNVIIIHRAQLIQHPVL